jgi:hypothetical protein
MCKNKLMILCSFLFYFLENCLPKNLREAICFSSYSNAAIIAAEIIKKHKKIVSV